MLILEINAVKKYFGEALILDIENLKIYENQKIGLIGDNGSGKTTLLKILTGELMPDEGSVNWYGSYRYIPQFEIEKQESYLSGGEKTKQKIKDAFSKQAELLLADEPTSNLDMQSIAALQKRLQNYDGAVLLISHDRTLLNEVCSCIIELDKAKIKIYPGNYSDYKEQKDLETKRIQFEYEQYIKEKERLEQSLQDKKEKISQRKHTPTRMGPSEARLHKGGSTSKKLMERKAKSLESRIEKLEVKERYKERKKAKINIAENSRLSSKIALQAFDMEQRFGSRLLFEAVNFTVETGVKAALIGDNGTGKTTIIKRIIDRTRDDAIKIAPSAKMAYFAQDLDILDENKTILENVKEGSALNETELRTMLSRVRITGNEVHKKVSLLSGGEKVKVSFIKIFSKDVNFLVLDEPTNYLDIFIAEALEDLIRDYNGTILFVTHDRALITNCAEKLLIIKNNTLEQFYGTYEEYQQKSTKAQSKEARSAGEEKLLLEARLAACVSQLSAQISKEEYARLDEEYKALLEQLRALQK